MKSSKEKLRERGFIEEGEELTSLGLSNKEILNYLNSSTPTQRTLAARLLKSRQDESTVNALINTLKTEKKLYTKIELCDALISQGKVAIQPLITELGKIGNNQLREVPDREFKKDNYPLPRDIVARTLVRFGSIALPELLRAIEIQEIKQLSEAIDALGYICFYHYSPEVFTALFACFSKQPDNDLLVFKLYRAMSGCPESTCFLQKQYEIQLKYRLKAEIKRSLRLLKAK